MQISVVIIALVAIAAIVILAAWSTARRQRSQGRQRSEQLREQFGPEYDRAVTEMGGVRKAEDELTARQERVSRYNIRHLTAEEGQSFSDAWQVIQASFVDDPPTAMHDADVLVGRVMQARGYPVGSYEERSADMSVEMSPILSHYRAAHDIAVRGALGHADTEDLRQAVVSSHVMFSELVEMAAVERPTPVEVPADSSEPMVAEPMAAE